MKYFMKNVLAVFVTLYYQVLHHTSALCLQEARVSVILDYEIIYMKITLIHILYHRVNICCCNGITQCLHNVSKKQCEVSDQDSREEVSKDTKWHERCELEIEYRRLADRPVTLDGDGDSHEDRGREGDAGHRVQESDARSIKWIGENFRVLFQQWSMFGKQRKI